MFFLHISSVISLTALVLALQIKISTYKPHKEFIKYHIETQKFIEVQLKRVVDW